MHLAGATEVKFGATSAESFEVVSANEITAVAPKGSGRVHVTVTTPEGGSSTPTSADEFEYIPPPVIEKLEPAKGRAAGAEEVTISGKNLEKATLVSFGGTAAEITSRSGSGITVVTPSGVGKVQVTVTTSGGSAEAEFTYEPSLASVAPSVGPAGGGTSVTITGTGFKEGQTSVKFNEAPAMSVTVASPTVLHAIAPPGAPGPATVTVSVEGVPGSSSVAFSYVLPPTITSVAPSEGAESGGTTVTITGSNFGGATAVHFGATPAGFEVRSPTTIVATSPAGSGKVDVTVTTAGGTSATSAADVFMYVASSPSPGPPPPPPPPAAATCTMKPIFLTVERKHKRKAKPKITAGQLKVTVTCSESASVDLAGRLSMAIGKKPKHGKQRAKIYTLGPSVAKAAQGIALVVSLKLPLKTVVALATKTKESVRITLSATSTGGTSHNSVSIKQLKL
jgi:hypothetical protein